MTERPPSGVRPHPTANEVVGQDELSRRRSAGAADRRKRWLWMRAGAGFVGLAVIVAGAYAAAVADWGGLAIVILLMIVPYVLLLMSPVILARLTKIGQDENVRAGRR